MNVGNSKKRNANNRGFRGIGRLGGMSYCDTLIFSTSYEGENCKTIVTFDCKTLKKLLVPGQYEDLSLSDVLGKITTIEVQPEKTEKHYFVVEMENVSGSSDLLNIDAAKSYISQVAPLPYQTRHFIYISQLKEFLKDHGYGLEEFPIFVGEEESDLEPVYKPNKSIFRADRNKKTVDEISSMAYFDVTIDGELADFEKQLRQYYAVKLKLAEEIDSLDPDDRHYIKRKADLDDRLYRMYDKIENVETQLIETRAKKQAIEAEKLTGDNIYKVLTYFEKLYAVMNEIERRQFMEALIYVIQIYEDRQSNGQWLKSIKFRLPVLEEDMSLSLEDDKHVSEI